MRISVLSMFAVGAIVGVVVPFAAVPAAQAAPGVDRAAPSPRGPGRPLAGTGISGGLHSVSATSSTSAWAVGASCTASACTLPQQRTLILRWNGTAWAKVKSPNPAPAGAVLLGVSAGSSSDAWAVGQYCSTSSCAVEKTLILHWNGTAWSQVTSPSPGPTTNVLSGVSATSSRDAWAVGSYCTTTSCDCTTTCAVQNTLILHWNGTSWSKVTAPPESSQATTLSGVSAAAPAAAWAVGYYCTTSPCNDHTLILHWNGTAWSKVTSPNPGSTFDPLSAVSATSPAAAWAVGDYCTTSSCPAVHTLTAHWNGTAWSTVTSPNVTARNALAGVAAASPANAWAVGNYCTSQCGLPTEIARTLTLHWNGTTWSTVTSPNTSAPINFLDGASTTSSTNAWAVGQYCTSIQCFVSHTLILHWNGATWSRT
jgi:hypothetical protein